MDQPRIIFISAAVIQLAIWLAMAARYRQPAAGPTTLVLRYGWKLRLLGVCIAFAIPMVTIVLFSVTASSSSQLVPLGMTLLVLGFVGGALLLETQGVYLVLTPDTIAGLSPWRRRREWRWDEIESVSYSVANRWLIIQGPRQQTIRASLFLVGIEELARALLRHVSGMKLAMARKVLDRLSEVRNEK